VNGALPYPFTPKAGANGALAAAPSKPGFGLLERKAAETRKKILCRAYGARFQFASLPTLPASHSHPNTQKPRVLGTPVARLQHGLSCGRASGASIVDVEKLRSRKNDDDSQMSSRCFAKKQIPPRMTRICKVKMVLLNFFDPCKSALSVLSVVRFGVFVQSLLKTRVFRVLGGDPRISGGGARWNDFVPRLQRSVLFHPTQPCRAGLPVFRATALMHLPLIARPGPTSGLNNSALRAATTRPDCVCLFQEQVHCPLSHLLRSPKPPRMWQRLRVMCDQKLFENRETYGLPCFYRARTEFGKWVIW
jgi:hypothetical protein